MFEEIYKEEKAKEGGLRHEKIDTLFGGRYIFFSFSKPKKQNKEQVVKEILCFQAFPPHRSLIML
ncbi:hypothetical protein MFLO_06534 [Listeria floridensis FSL S10-1187]|uniref:Uncharacterized protein n=1 Tax=Listeria floridensis FSL S10-1187 TaxID=1265817 RepID=A0ABP3B170_9LIST|nr:hypothetical protein [Listeria floridensis]EUJ32742.1 hypothetical protein MFLO_06534 [Listeria floridensis FSL S10-1187]